MTPQTLLIDRNFKGVGRIKRATGTMHGKVRVAMSRMLTELHQTGRLDVLRSIRDGRLTLIEVYDAFRRHAVDSLPSGNTLESLETAWTKFVENMDASDSYRRDYRTSLKYFLAEKPDAKVSDLPAILEALRDTLGKKHPRSFNSARSHAGGFVRRTLKRNHPLWAAIGAVEKRKEDKKRKGNPLTPAQMRSLFPNPETDQVDGIAWSMATTGIHEKEYWHDGWEVEGGRIRVHGKKRKARDRFVPLVLSPVVPRIHPRTFTDKLRERTARFIQPYDLRRTYANWLEAAGIPRARRNIYRGHSSKDIGDLYERHEVDAFLIEDAARLRAHLDLPPTIPHTLTLHKVGGA